MPKLPRNLRENRPVLFSPSVIRAIVQDDIGTNSFHKTDYEALGSTALDNTASFRYNLPGDGLRSTQQLNIDWSYFENHTFFNSAHVKTNVAFRKIFDQFPFDGTQSEFEVFMDGLTGFEKYVYDEFPKHKGYLYFSGSSGPSSGTYVTVKDVAGVAYPGVSKKLTGESILNPGTDSMTVEFWAYVPSGSVSSSVILEKLSSGNHGFYTYYDGSNTKVVFSVFSGSAHSLTTEMAISQSQWNHIAFVWDRSTGVNQVFSYLNNDLVHSSSQRELGTLNMDSADLLIGSGTVAGTTTTFSGALDELRIWHSARTQEEREKYQRKGNFAEEDLKLYFKFNEASGSQTPIVLDHSSNSLHGTLSTWAYDHNVREVATGSVAGSTPMTYEKVENNPILFPLHPDVEDLNQDLLDSAEEFDRVNPNRIDRLIPKHYLLKGQHKDGLDTEEGDIIEALSATGSTPDTAKLGNTQVILLLLYTWAKFFDEMKLYIQAFGDMIHLDYDSTDNIPDSFLHIMAQQAGVQLPPLFTGTSIEQFINAENLDNDYSTGSYPLQYIQNQIWRRILLNLQDILKSKGTIHAVKSFIRAVGIDPDNNFRIREFGGPSKRALENVRETKSEASTLLNFVSGGFIRSPYMLGTRTEPGYPERTNSPKDGLFTSGSWSFEGIYRLPMTASLTATTQSLVRVMVTGADSSRQGPGAVITNLIAIPNRGLILHMNPWATADLALTLSADVFDGNPWYISFGRQRNDDGLDSTVSSSIFLRAARQEFGEIIEERVTASYYNEDLGSGLLNWSTTSSFYNASGAWLEIGNNADISLANIGFATSLAEKTASFFEGKVGHIRFWSKFLDLNEWREHVRNFKSMGVEDPRTNFNFVTSTTGSFQRIRMDVSTDQMELETDSTGSIMLTDFSQNNLHWSGSNFPVTTSVIQPQRFHYSLLSPKFDTGATTDKVRVRSFQQYENILSSSYSQVAPVYLLEPADRPQDNTRFTIDFSIVDALDQDIVNIFSTLDILDNILGNPELMYSPDYPGLETLRDVYFNRLTDKVNLKQFFEFYKWFDKNIGTFIAQLLPRKTKFLGTNFVIESHMLERAKMEYFSSDIYLGDTTRHALKDTIRFQQFVTKINRF